MSILNKLFVAKLKPNSLLLKDSFCLLYPNKQTGMVHRNLWEEQKDTYLRLKDSQKGSVE